MRKRRIAAAALVGMVVIIGGQGVAFAGQDQCFSKNGDLKNQKGTAYCSTTEGKTSAKATGDGAVAVVSATSGTAVAKGDSAVALIVGEVYLHGENSHYHNPGGDDLLLVAPSDGSGFSLSILNEPSVAAGTDNKVVAKGDSALAVVAEAEYYWPDEDGSIDPETAEWYLAAHSEASGNTVTASGDGSEAFVYGGDSNTVTANGTGTAIVYDGNENVVTAYDDVPTDWEDSWAIVYGGDGNIVTAYEDSSASTTDADGNTVTAHEGANAWAVGGSGNFVDATGEGFGGGASGNNNVVIAENVEPGYTWAQVVGDDNVLTGVMWAGAVIGDGNELNIDGGSAYIEGNQNAVNITGDNGGYTLGGAVLGNENTVTIDGDDSTFNVSGDGNAVTVDGDRVSVDLWPANNNTVTVTGDDAVVVSNQDDQVITVP